MAATQVLNGVSILLKVGTGSATAVVGAKDGSVTITTNMIDGTHKSTTDTLITPGRSNLSFEASGFVYVGGTGSIANLMSTQIAGTVQEFECDLESTDSITCQVYIEECSVQAPDADAPTFSIRGRSSAAITVTPSA